MPEMDEDLFHKIRLEIIEQKMNASLQRSEITHLAMLYEAIDCTDITEQQTLITVHTITMVSSKNL